MRVRAISRTALFGLLAAGFLLAGPAPAAAKGKGKGKGKCTITGSSKADNLRGTPGRDVICGRGGDDRLFGRGGNDRLLGGAGGDELGGGPGKDTLSGGGGDDILTGGPGVDRLDGGPGNNICDETEGTRANCAGDLQMPQWPGPGSGGWPTTCPGYEYPTCPDIEVPGLSWLDVSPTFADVATGSNIIQLNFWGYDFGSGLAAMRASIRGPAGHWKNVDLVQGEFPSTEENFTAEIALGAGTPDGTYVIDGVTVTDKSGNEASFDEAEVADIASAYSFDVIHGPDPVKPVLADFTITPLHQDTSTGPGAIDFEIHGTDNLAGIGSVVLKLKKPGLSTNYHLGIGRSSGTPTDGVWGYHLSIPAHSKPGAYAVQGIEIEDRKGNSLELSRAQLIAAGYDVDAFQDGAGDETPPVIHDVSISPKILSAGRGDDTLTYSLHLSDALSGLGTWPSFDPVDVSIDGPPGLSGWSGTVASQISGTEFDGIWRGTIKLDHNAPIGDYRISYASAHDRAYNVTVLTSAQLEAFDLTFENRH